VINLITRSKQICRIGRSLTNCGTIHSPERLFSVDFKVTIIKTFMILQNVFSCATLLLYTRGNGGKRKSMINRSLNTVFFPPQDQKKYLT